MANFRNLGLCCCLSLTFATCVSLAEDAAPPAMTAPIGVAKLDITPDTPVRMYGYASRTTESEGVAGKLSAKALVIGGDQSPGPAVLLAVDCGAVPRSIYDDVFRRVNAVMPIQRSRFVLCNSHCHSGPNLKEMGSLQGSELEHMQRYAGQLTDRLVRVVQQAIDNRQPATLAIARGSVAIAANRRVLKDGKWTGFGAIPEAPVDHELAVLKVTNSHGEVTALIANYACHNTTLRGDFQQIHGDWAGSAQHFLDTELPGTTTLITIGCGADSDPCPHGTVALCDRHGRALADEVTRLLAGSWHPLPTSLSAKRKLLEIPWQLPDNMDAARQAAKQSWAIEFLISHLDEEKQLPEPRTFEINTWVFGNDLAMVFFTDEMVVDYVLRLKQEFDARRLWVGAYTNDVSSYIVSPRIIQEGGYEARNSLSSMITLAQPESLDPPMMERILEAVHEMLPETYRVD